MSEDINPGEVKKFYGKRNLVRCKDLAQRLITILLR